MNHQPVFYYCPICKNLVEVMGDTKGKLVCCGKPMAHLEPNTEEASHEKHIPVAELVNDTLVVRVGSVPHPMTVPHNIEWILVKHENYTQRVDLPLTGEPMAVFTPVTGGDIYAYCNLHGLWKGAVVVE